MYGLRVIADLDKLKEEAEDGVDCIVLLNEGLESSKQIWYNDVTDEFEITNMVDNTQQTLTSDEIMDSEIGIALIRGSLIKDI